MLVVVFFAVVTNIVTDRSIIIAFTVTTTGIVTATVAYGYNVVV